MTKPQTRPWLRVPVEEKLRLFAEIDPLSGCHNWTRYVDPHGYGWVWDGHRDRMVHRVAYVLAKGEIPPDLVVDHLCRNRRCCNPQHLEAVTQRENLLRGVGIVARNARKTHCAKGHEFNAANTRFEAAGGRACRACGRAWSLKYWHARKSREAAS